MVRSARQPDRSPLVQLSQHRHRGLWPASGCSEGRPRPVGLLAGKQPPLEIYAVPRFQIDF
jgi:hypothetical protein